MNELLLDQLPVLRDLARVVDEMALGVDTTGADQHRSSRLVIEQVPVMREAILRAGGSGWAALAAQQREEAFGKGASGRQTSRKRAGDCLAQRPSRLPRVA